MITEERAIFDAFAAAANGYGRDAVVGAAANLLVNVLRQSHRKRGEADEEVDALAADVKRLLGRHYDEDGVRKERTLVLPPLFPTGA